MPEDVETPDVETPEAPDLAALQAELEKARRALKDANKEAADRRKKLEQFEQAEEQRKQAEMTELDKAKAEAEQARKEAEQARTDARAILIRSAFVSEAAKAGAAHPEDAYALADTSGVEVGDDGKVAGVADAVKALVDAGRIPLAGKAPAPSLDGGAGGKERSGETRLTAQELQAAKNMGITPERYAEQKAAIAQRQKE